MIESREQPYCFQTLPAMERLYAHYDGPERHKFRATAALVYQTATVLAAQQYREWYRRSTEGKPVRRQYITRAADVAQCAGLHERTVRARLKELCALGLVAVRRVPGGVDLALLPVSELDPTGSETRSTGSEARSADNQPGLRPGQTGSETRSLARAQEDAVDVEVPSTPTNGNGKEEERARKARATSPSEQLAIDGSSNGNGNGPGLPAVKFDGEPVPPPVVEQAVAVLHHFASKGVRARPFTGRGKPSEALRLVIGRMLDDPDVPLGQHCAIVDAVLDDPKPWWSGGPTVNVVYGPKVWAASLAAPDKPESEEARLWRSRREAAERVRKARAEQGKPDLGVVT